MLTNNDTNCSQALVTSSFTMTTSNSSQAANSILAVSNLRAITSGDSVPREFSRETSSSQLGDGILEYVGPLVEPGLQEKPLSVAMREIHSDLLEHSEGE